MSFLIKSIALGKEKEESNKLNIHILGADLFRFAVKKKENLDADRCDFYIRKI